MSGSNDSTPTLPLDNSNTHVSTNDNNALQSTLTLAMIQIQDLIEGKKRQEKEIEDLKRMLSPKEKDEDVNGGLVNMNFDDLLVEDAPSTIHGVSPTKNLNKNMNFFEYHNKCDEKNEKSPHKNKNLFPRSSISHTLFDDGVEGEKKEEEDEFINIDSTNAMGINNDTLRAKWTVPKLGKRNYVHWKQKVDYLLKFKNLIEFVETRFPEPERRSPHFIRFNEAYIIVANSVSEDVMSTLGELQTNPYDLYQRIKEINNPITASSRLVNRIKYFQIKCSDASSITKFCSNIESMSQKIDSFSLFSEKMLERMTEMSVTEIVKEVIKVIDEADRLAILLGGLPEEFETQANILRADASTTYIKAKELLEAAAFQFKSEKPGKKDSVASASEKRITCHVCKKTGHKAVDCRSRGRGKGRGRGREKSQNEDEVSYMFMATTQPQEDTEAKYATVDSGATKHIAGSSLKELILNKSKLEKPCLLHLPNGEKLIAREKGDVKITLGEAKSQQHFIKDVIYSEDVSSNVLLVSVAKICDKGARVLFDAKGCKIQMREKKQWKTVIQAKRRGDLYQFPLNKFDTSDEESVNLIINRETEPNEKIKPKRMRLPALLLLHQRLGHASPTEIKNAIKGKFLKGTSDKVLEQVLKSCTVCAETKIRRSARPNRSTTTATEPLERSHCDTSGKMKVKTGGGKKYFSVVVDEATWHIDTRLLKNKSEVSTHIKDYKTKYENLLSKKMKVVRTDNAKEYLGKDFRGMLHDAGIHTEQCTDYEHAQNPYAERAIGILTEIANCMLTQSNAPSKLWGEAIQAANIVHNLTPKKCLGHKTPWELWSGRVPDLNRLRTWGCLAFAQIPKEKRWKFEPRGVKCIMVGYDLECKAWRLMRLNNHRIISTCNAIFMESVFPYKVKEAADIVIEHMVPGGITGIRDYDFEDIEREVKGKNVDFEITANGNDCHKSNGNNVNNKSNPKPDEHNASQNLKAHIKIEKDPDIENKTCANSSMGSERSTSNSPSMSKTRTIHMENDSKGEDNEMDWTTPGVKKMMEGFDHNAKRKTRNANPVYNVEGEQEYEDVYLYLARTTMNYDEAMELNPVEFGKARDSEFKSFADLGVFEIV